MAPYSRAITAASATARQASVHPPIETRLTSLFKCRYPLILPGMSWISTPELVAAVSNAGGVGILATGPLTPEQTQSSINRIRSLLQSQTLPFGVGITLLMPNSTANAKIALSSQVPIINVSLGKPDWITTEAHSYGGKILSTVTNAKHAEAALSSADGGVDAIMATGHEAAAHGGDVTSMVLLPTLRERYPEIPLVGAGGFANGRGLSAALALGADGVAMGSRLAVTRESPLAGEVKGRVSSDGFGESETLYGKNFDGIPARVMDTDVARRLSERPARWPLVFYRAFMSARAMGIPLWKVVPGLITDWDKMYAVAQFGAATEAIQAATVHGDLDENGVQFIGQCQGLIHDIPTVHDMVQRIMWESRMVASQNASLFSDLQHDLRQESTATS